MTQYLAANGAPFTDPDAAEFKAERMATESGLPFEVVEVEGGYAVAPADNVVPMRSPAVGPPTDQPVSRRPDDPPGDDSPDQAPSSAPAATSAAAELRSSGPLPAAGRPPFVITLRPAWRAQLTSFGLMLLGVLLVIAPTWPVAIFSADAVHEINERLPGIWDDIALAGFVLTLMGNVVLLWRRYYQKSVLTNNGVMQSVGIVIHRHVSQIEMRNIHVVEVKQPSLVHLLLNLGTVELSTPGSSGADVAIVNVVSPKKLAEFIRYHKDRAKDRSRNQS